MSLFWRSFLANAVTVATAAVILALSPATVSYPVTAVEGVLLGVGLVVVYLINGRLIRTTLRPLQTLQRSIESIDRPDSGGRVEVEGPGEIASLATAYNSMLDRLDAERENSSRKAIAAQEDERSRVSSELHDEVGQTLTALLLKLSVVASTAPPEMADDLADARESVRAALDEVRSISARLRPGVLRDLGLLPALRGLVAEVGSAAGIPIEISLPERADLSEELQLVVYRVAQESLTNVVRHAGATRAWLQLSLGGGAVVLRIRDDGVGTTGAPETGLVGMEERARLVGGRLLVTPVPGTGTTVELTVPREAR